MNYICEFPTAFTFTFFLFSLFLPSGPFHRYHLLRPFLPSPPASSTLQPLQPCPPAPSTFSSPFLCPSFPPSLRLFLLPLPISPRYLLWLMQVPILSFASNPFNPPSHGDIITLNSPPCSQLKFASTAISNTGNAIQQLNTSFLWPTDNRKG